MVVSVEEIASSLVREYLSRKGLKKTIACMDEEQPRTEGSVNNRSELRQILDMDGLYTKNKLQKNPLKTMLEVLVKHHIEEHKTRMLLNSDCDLHPSLIIESKPASDGTPQTPEVIPVVDDYGLDESSGGGAIRKHIKSRAITEEAISSCDKLLLPETARHPTYGPTSPCAADKESLKQKRTLASIQDNGVNTNREQPPMDKSNIGNQKNRTYSIRRGMMAGPIASAALAAESNKNWLLRRVGAPHSLLEKEEGNRPSKNCPSVIDMNKESLDSKPAGVNTDGFLQETQQLLTTPVRRKSKECSEIFGNDLRKTKKEKPMTNLNVGLQGSEMILDDIEYDKELQGLSDVTIYTGLSPQSYKSDPMDLHTAIALKEVLLGSSSFCFSAEWKNQAFTFSDAHDLRYGIVQKKGGPCGVLATIQAYILKKLLFQSADSSSKGLERLRPSNSTRQQGLILAAAEVLWRAGDKSATLAITSAKSNFIHTGYYKSEGILEKIICFTVYNIKDLQNLLEQHIKQFESGPYGCILLVISAILSRTIAKVRQDMDVALTSLIARNGYCTQELVNLLLCGQAVSNVFNDEVELDSGSGHLTLLKGIKSRCDIGLLSLFEHYNICQVGSNLKEPQFPIWVVCSESHFTVLFGLQRALLTDTDKHRQFDLYYYDGLANQQEEIRLSVSVGTATLSSLYDPDLIPPLELCIKTKWKDSVVCWNNTEPIL